MQAISAPNGKITISNNETISVDDPRMKMAIALELMSRGLGENAAASGMNRPDVTANTELVAQAAKGSRGDLEGRPGAAADALRNAQSSVRSLGVTLHETEEGHIEMHRRFQALIDVVDDMDLKPRDEEYIAHHAAKLSDILAPLQADRNPIRPLGGTDDIVKQVDMILHRLESYVDAKGGNIEVGPGPEQLKSVDESRFDKFISDGGEVQGAGTKGNLSGGTEIARRGGAGGVEAPTSSLPLNSPARALFGLDAAYQSMSSENKAAYNQQVSITTESGDEIRVAPYSFLREVTGIGGNRLSIREQNAAEGGGEPAFEEAQRERIIDVTSQIRELFAQPTADPEKLLKLVLELEKAVTDVIGPLQL